MTAQRAIDFVETGEYEQLLLLVILALFFQQDINLVVQMVENRFSLLDFEGFDNARLWGYLLAHISEIVHSSRQQHPFLRFQAQRFYFAVTRLLSQQEESSDEEEEEM